MREQIQNVTNVVNSVQSAAYGQRGSVLATNNLLLAGNQLFWTFLDPLLQTAGITSATSPSFLARLAPLGSLLTGHVALGNRQHVRFISGLAVFDGTTAVALTSLRNRIGSAFWPEFRRRTNIPVTAAFVGAGAIRDAPPRRPRQAAAWAPTPAADR